MEKATRFKKARIIALDAGVFIGSVARLILDLDARQVAGLLLEGGTTAIDGEDVRALGEDAVTITTAANIIDLNEATELADFIRTEDEVYRKEVFTVTGKKVGFITDVLIEPASRAIVGFEMFSETIFQDDVHGVVLLNEEVIFGRDLVLVPADIEGLIARSAEEVAQSAEQGLPPARPALRAVEPASSPSLSKQFPVEPTPASPEPLTLVEANPLDESAALDQSLAGTDSGPVDAMVVEREGEFVPDTEAAVSLPPAAVDEQTPPPPDAIEEEQPSPMTLAAPIEAASPVVDFSETQPAAEGQFETSAAAPAAVGEEADVSIDFSGVDVPQPEVLREAPEPVATNEATESKPDMAKIFASFPLGVDGQTQSDVDRPIEVPSSVATPPAAASPPAPAVKESPKDKLIRFVLGKTSSRDIFDVDGNLILAKGQEISEEVVAKAQAAELMPQVFLAASQGLHSRLKRT